MHPSLSLTPGPASFTHHSSSIRQSSSPPLSPSSSTLTITSSVLSSLGSESSSTTTLSYKDSSSSTSTTRRSFRKPTSSTLLSVKLLSHKLGGFYKLFSSSASDPVLSTITSKAHPHLGRSKSCDRALTMSELTRRCSKKPRGGSKKNIVEQTMSLRAMELEALINDYPGYTLHLTLTPRLCLDK